MFVGLYIFVWYDCIYLYLYLYQSPHIFWDRVFHRTWTSPVPLDWLASEHRWSFCLFPLPTPHALYKSDKLIDICCSAWLLHGPHACMACFFKEWATSPTLCCFLRWVHIAQSGLEFARWPRLALNLIILLLPPPEWWDCNYGRAKKIISYCIYLFILRHSFAM